MDWFSGSNGIILLISLFLLTFLGMFLTRKRKMWQGSFTDRTPREEKLLQRITVLVSLLSLSVIVTAIFASSIWFYLSIVLFVISSVTEMYMEYKLQVSFSLATGGFIRGKTVRRFLPLFFVIYVLIILGGLKLRGII